MDVDALIFNCAATMVVTVDYRHSHRSDCGTVITVLRGQFNLESSLLEYPFYLFYFSHTIFNSSTSFYHITLYWNCTFGFHRLR